MKPAHQTWPEDFAARYRAAGYWTGETFPALLRARAAERPGAVALVDGERRWSYAELHARAERLAAGFRALGLAPGERVLVQMGNVAEFVAVIFGLFRAHLAPVYALPAHRLTEVAHLARRSEAAAYVGLAEWDGFDYRPMARALRAEAPGLGQVILAGGEAPFVALADCDAEPLGLPGDPDPASVAFMQISGGTTGLPKLIPRTHDDYIYSLRASNAICGVTGKSVYLVALPAAHNFPMSSPGFLGALHAGATVVMCPNPSPETAFPIIAREGVTLTGLVPPLALFWTRAAETRGKAELASLESLLVGGAKLAPEVARRIGPALGCRLRQVFGMAEGLVNYTRDDDPEEITLTTQGRPISAADEIRVVGDDGDPVAEGAPGHLETRGPYTIRGYHDDPEANARSFTPDGFYRTGDIARRLPSGHLEVLGRAGDHINRAGEKVSAEEVEDHLLAHEAVFDAIVVSVPDPALGEHACAFVVPNGEAPKPHALKRFMRERGIAAFKIPDRFVFVERFETTAVGKIDRKDLRARLREKVREEEFAK